MKGLLSAGAARAWLVVALVGFVIVVLVLALGLGARLRAGQDVLDAAKPALSDERVAGDRAGVDFISKYVDFADPLMTPRGGGRRELTTLVDLVARRAKLSRARVAALLRRSAPHAEALLRALPLSSVTREIPAFTGYLATTLNITDEGLAAELERSFPRLSQALTALPGVTTGWNDIPGIGGLTRFDGDRAVQTVPQLRGYLARDVVATLERDKGDLHDLAGRGGIGLIPTLLLVVGAVLLVFGLLQARRARDAPPGRPSWAFVMAIGALLVVLVFALGYFPRLRGADRAISDLAPAFAAERVAGARAGSDMIHQTVLLGDPIATRRGGAPAEIPELLTFVRQRTSLDRAAVLGALRRRAPHLSALLQAIPLTAAARELPHLLTVLGRRTRLSRPRLIATLRKRTPHLAQSLLALRTVSLRWNQIPGTERLTRFDGVTRVRTMPALDRYLAEDLVPLFERQRQNFRDLADPAPKLAVLAPALLALGVALIVFGLAMTRSLLTKRW